MNSIRMDSGMILIIAMGLLGAAFMGYTIATLYMKTDNTYIPPEKPATGLSAQYGTGITATPGLTADNYTAPTAWIQVGIIKTEDQSESTFYPLYERRIAPHLNIFQYRAVAIDRNNYIIPLPDQPFLETGTSIGVIKGLESKGVWVVDRYSNTRWAYTQS